MIAYRISREEHQDSIFSGAGGLMASGRWTSQGHPVIYVARSPEAATLETLVHYPDRETTPALVIATIEIPDEIEIGRIDQSALPIDWDDPEDNNPQVQAFGDLWLTQNSIAVLAVPSALIDGAFNYLINPLNLDFKRLVQGTPKPLKLDKRLSA